MDPIAAHYTRSRLGLISGLAISLAAVGLVTGCSVAGASPSPTSEALPSPVAVSFTAVSPSLGTATPTLPPYAASSTTVGVASNWTGFSWSRLPADNPLATADPWRTGAQLLAWQHGYVVYGTTNGNSNAFVWTSADGQTWTQVTAIVAPRVLVAACAAGLVAVAGDPSATGSTQMVWASSDGVQWHIVGALSGLAFVDSIAGTSAGLVATGHTLNGAGKFATSTFSVAFSTDGISWTPIEVEPGIAWDDVGPQVQSGNNRFFVMGGLSDSQAKGADFRFDALDVTGVTGRSGPVGASQIGKGGLWWSDDGRKWKSTGTWAYADALVFGRDGILVHENPRLIPGYVGLDVSTDGGKTWAKATNYGPLGAAVCGQGECSEGPDGVIASNGTVFVAVKSNGRIWTSYDGKTWTPIAGNGPVPDLRTFLVLPRGVILAGSYGAAK
ncbi:MAG: hypothetical protein ABSC46_08140 [Candidatus Limnocylindrales bacterium]|jgi:hypothetical protein